MSAPAVTSAAARRRRSLAAAALPIAAVAAVLAAALIVATPNAVGQLGPDFLAYRTAIARALGGGPLYDLDIAVAGPIGEFLYPPTFALLFAPVAAIPADVAVVLAALLMGAAYLLALAILPVSARTRWLVLLATALTVPVLHGVKLGQVGPVLALLFAAGWRWLDRPGRLGATIALGTAIKVQPVLLVAWAVATGRRRAAAIAVLVLGLLAVGATLVFGPGAWADDLTITTRVNQPLAVVGSASIGRLATEAGLAAGTATALQVGSALVAVVLLVVATLRGAPVGSYLAVVVGSQLLSPIVWDHYLVVLALPVAWLLDRGRRWALLIPLATLFPLGVADLRVVYLGALWVTLAAVVAESLRGRVPEAVSAAGLVTTPGSPPPG